MKQVSFMNWFNGPIPQRRYTVQGRPLPKGMSPCIVGFIVTQRRK